MKLGPLSTDSFIERWFEGSMIYASQSMKVLKLCISMYTDWKIGEHYNGNVLKALQKLMISTKIA